MATLVHSPVPQLLGIPTGFSFQNVNFLFFLFFLSTNEKHKRPIYKIQYM